MTQTQMAEILHCSQRIYSNYERGDVDIPTQVLIKLALFHSTSVDYLLGITDQKAPYIKNIQLENLNHHGNIFD